MKFTIERTTFLDNLNFVQRGLSIKTPMPILTGVNIEVNKNNLVLTTSNSDISTKAKVESNLEVSKEGVIVLPGKILIDIIRKVNSKTVTLEEVEHNLIVLTAGKSEFTLNSMQKDDYPKIKFISQDNPVELNARTLRTVIRQTTFATSLTENRPILTGVNLSTAGNELTCVATDSYRLSKKSIEFETAISKR